MSRDLGEEEKELWRKVVESITPLSNNNVRQEPAPKSAVAQNNALQQGDSQKHYKQPDNEHLENSANPTREDLAAALSRPIAPSVPKRANRIINQDSIKASQKSAHNGLDGHWEKRFNKGAVIPDISIDLHGAGLQSAYDRLDGALEQARVQKLRVILLVTGRQRHYDRASGEGRGGIRAVMSDWLSASRHSDYIASVRNAHPRHGGAGALYIILRK